MILAIFTRFHAFVLYVLIKYNIIIIFVTPRPQPEQKPDPSPSGTGCQPVSATYSSIRRHSNIILVAGSGFGSADDTGDWSITRFGLQPMPFDGFLFASRVMVAKEAHTSSSVEDLIVAASGTTK